MPVKICFITNFAYRLFNPKSKIIFGGIETIFYLLAKDLAADKNFQVSFLLEDDVKASFKSETISDINLYKTSRRNRLGFYRDPQIKKYDRWFRYWAGKFDRLWQLPHLDFFRMWEKLKQISADVYIFASPGYESGLITLVTKIIRKKSVFILVNDEILKDKKLFFFLKLADLVISYSSRHQQELRQRYGIRAVYLPPWYPRPKKIYGFRVRKYLLWVGRIEARKHPEVFIKLAKMLPDTFFKMVVAPAPNEVDLYQKIIYAAVNIPNLTVEQNVNFTDLNPYFQKALAFVDTSGYKNLNMTQVQAVATGVPCLSYFYDPNDSLKIYRWGLYAGSDFKQMKKNIGRLESDEKLWNTLSENAHRFADEVYNHEKNLVQFKQQIFSLLK